MMIVLKKVLAEKEIQAVSDMANVIWHEHYSTVISIDQIGYMLENYQSSAAISQSISEGYEYYFISYEGTSVGYIAIKIDSVKGEMFLSKIYILSAHRGKGFAYHAINQLLQMCNENGLNKIRLTVNKNNPSTERYKRIGFYIVDSIVTDIGNGFVMDDYVMEIKV